MINNSFEDKEKLQRPPSVESRIDTINEGVVLLDVALNAISHAKAQTERAHQKHNLLAEEAAKITQIAELANQQSLAYLNSRPQELANNIDNNSPSDDQPEQTVDYPSIDAARMMVEDAHA